MRPNGHFTPKLNFKSGEIDVTPSQLLSNHRLNANNPISTSAYREKIKLQNQVGLKRGEKMLNFKNHNQRSKLSFGSAPTKN